MTLSSSYADVMADSVRERSGTGAVGLTTAIAAVIYGALLAAAWAVGQPTIVSDAREYVVWSWAPLAPNEYNYDHVPGFPMAIWAARLLTFGLVGDAVLAHAVSFGCWLVGLIYVDRLLAELAPAMRRPGVVLFGLWPFVGVAGLAMPIADGMALAAILAAMYHLRHRAWWAVTAAIAVGSLAHRGMWPFVVLLGLAGIVRHGYPLWQAALSAVPLGAYWLHGVVVRGLPLGWLGTEGVGIRVGDMGDERGGLPFHVLVELLTGGDPAKAAKGAVILGLLLVTAALTAHFARRREWPMLAILVPVIALCGLLDEGASWAAMRFGRLITIPLMIRLAMPDSPLLRPGAARLAVPAAGLLVASQLAFGYYMYRYMS